MDNSFQNPKTLAAGLPLLRKAGVDLSNCFLPIRTPGRGRALTILVDLVRLNELLSAQVRSRLARVVSASTGQGAGPGLSQESA